MKKENSLAKDDNILDFNRVAANGGGDSGDNGWLETLGIGTCFLSRQRTAKYVDGKYLDPELVEQHVVHKTPTTTFLIVNMPDGTTLRRHVDTRRYSNAYELVVVMGITHPSNKEEKEDGGTNPVQ